MKTHREEKRLKGPVKSVRLEVARFEEQYGELLDQPDGFAMTFNQDGWIIETVNLHIDRPNHRFVSEYSGRGAKLSTRTYDAAGNLVREVKYGYLYDQHERLVAEQSVAPDGTVTTLATYTYDNEGLKTKVETPVYPPEVNSESKPTRIETCYNEREEPVEVRNYDADGIISSRTKITRDERGNVLEESHHVGDRPWTSDSCSVQEEALTEEQRAEIDRESARMFPAGSMIRKCAYKYDERGRLIETTLTVRRLILDHQTIKYDEAGNEEVSSFDEQGRLGSKTIITYEYDDRGNWIKQLISWQGSSTPESLIRRTITYY
jgi:antitoxin component YwqK of YwqJK toxin-antitoxin module